MIETARLTLRPMLATDVDALLSIFADPKVMESFDAAPFEHGQMERWVQRNLDRQAQYGYGLFSVICKSSSLVIGDCGLEQMVVDGVLTAELGYDFRSDHWHQGFATEAAISVRDYAFQVLGLPQLISLIRVGNHASQRVAARIGMTARGELIRYGSRYWQYAITADAVNLY